MRGSRVSESFDRYRRTVIPIGVGLVVVAALSAACGTATPGAVPPVTAGQLSAAQLAGGAAHACLPGAHGPATIDWSALSNPIISAPRAAEKDEALVWAGGRWHALFSYLTDDPSVPGGVRWDIATAVSPDLRTWSAPSVWPRQARVLGVASPDVVRDPSGGYLVSYQSDPGSSGPPATEDRLFFRTSPDLSTWSPPHPLAADLAPTPGERMIDGAFVFTGNQLLLGFKYSSPTQPQVFEIARSTSGRPEGPWVVVGRPGVTVNGDTVENYEFLVIGGQWRLVATSNQLDQPWLFTLAGDPRLASGWLRWSAGTQLTVPSEAFNTGPGISGVTFEHANSAFVCDASSLPGRYVYLLYAASPELTRFGGWGHAEIGVARSTDLVHWRVPPA